ncbi:oxidative stress survival, Svf1-like protein [Ascobolus immersus RN42]|uniref:Oxidative stress survival, Svf1-like protein n=1 Tax=Ascobolus immersus RN42 TaxID=1160509 RepID=A0A3N4HY70_ASCIM|nr:oxidative stress survival, Svf1-like protein [Ascobolus immersus RN42]
MFSWATKAVQSGLSVVAGTAEPIYGPDHIKTVATQESLNPTYELRDDDLRWRAYDYTCVETQTWYLTADNGMVALVQAIYSNVLKVQKNTQFVVKVFYPGNDGKVHWSSTELLDQGFDDEQFSFYAENLAIVLSEDKNSYKIMSKAAQDTQVNLEITRAGPGFKVGSTGETLYGPDPQNPWGSMRHVFWPRTKVSGNIVINGEKIDFAGKALYIMACQGMKPHHAAARWNFVDFQGPTYSALMMEFTTPPSYGDTVVNVACIVTDDKLIGGGTKSSAEHVESKLDPEPNWPQPTHLKYTWNLNGKDGKPVTASLEYQGERRERVDIMGEIPAVVKKIIGGVAGTKPYIYQYITKESPLKIKIGDEEITEQGTLYSEATFIS